MSLTFTDHSNEQDNMCVIDKSGSGTDYNEHR